MHGSRRKTRERRHGRDAMMYVASVIHSSETGVDLSIIYLLVVFVALQIPLRRLGGLIATEASWLRMTCSLEELETPPSITIMGDGHSPRTQLSVENDEYFVADWGTK